MLNLLIKFITNHKIKTKFKYNYRDKVLEHQYFYILSEAINVPTDDTIII